MGCWIAPGRPALHKCNCVLLERAGHHANVWVPVRPAQQHAPHGAAANPGHGELRGQRYKHIGRVTAGFCRRDLWKA
jgi:hypothetical protein